ncbi:retrotransposon protein, putative, ty1-copia subclass [Tanacetum coccineum]
MVQGSKLAPVQVIGLPERLASQVFLDWNVPWQLPISGSCQIRCIARFEWLCILCLEDMSRSVGFKHWALDNRWHSTMPKPKQTVRLSGQCLRSINLLDNFYMSGYCAAQTCCAYWKNIDVLKHPWPPALPQVLIINPLLMGMLFLMSNEVACLMLGTMSPKLYQQFENKSPQEMITEQQKMYGKPPGVELQELANMFHSSELMKKKKTRGQNVASTSSGIYTIELFAFPKNSWVYDTGCGTHICNTKQGLRGAKKLKRCSLYLYVDNVVRAKVEAIGSFDLVLPNGLIVFNNEVENQLEKTIKAIRSDLGGEYTSQEFKDYLKAYGIVQQLTPPYTPQHNESAARILNMVPTKKVDKTPYELWHGKVPNLSYLKVYGCEAHVKCYTPDKLQQRSVKCIFVGYPKETMGYYFYYPLNTK